MKPLLFLCLGAALVASARAAAPLEIKLATILPKDTSGHHRLMELRDAWQSASRESLRLTLYAGTGDSEVGLVRKMRSRQIHAALISAVGLSQIDRSVTCLQIMPLTFRNWAEVDHVRERIRHDLEGRLREKGFEVLFWADAGWVRFFSRQPALRPADIKSMKLFVWAGEPHQVSILRNMGYQPVGLETDQILPALTTGMIDVVPVPPFMANALRYSGTAKHMLDLNWVPIVGAAVVRRDTWEKVPAELRPELLRLAMSTGERLRARARDEDDAAISAMQKKGLTVHRVSSEAMVEWRASVEQAYPQMRGTMVPAELFDQVHAHLAAFRAMAGGAQQ